MSMYDFLEITKSLRDRGDMIASMDQGQYHQHTAQNAEQALSSTVFTSI